MCSLVHHRNVCRAVEHNEREIIQVDLMDLMEDILPCALIHCRQFLLIEGIQGMIALEVHVASALGWDLVACKLDRIVGVIGIRYSKLGDIVPPRHPSRGR